jgi:hypothetical protein
MPVGEAFMEDVGKMFVRLATIKMIKMGVFYFSVFIIN